MRKSEFLCVGVLNLQYNIKFKNLLNTFAGQSRSITLVFTYYFNHQQKLFI